MNYINNEQMIIEQFKIKVDRFIQIILPQINNAS